LLRESYNKHDTTGWAKAEGRAIREDHTSHYPTFA
jgi:hypothetical protein